MPDFGFDDWMDAQLRGVPVPRDLHARLRAARPPADDVPPLGEAGEPGESLARSSDARMDALLRNVEIPETLHRDLRRISRWFAMPRTWRDVSRGAWAAAASMLIVTGAGTYWIVGRDASTSAPQQIAAKVPSPQAPAPQTVVASPANAKATNSNATAKKSTRSKSQLARAPVPQPSPAGRRQRPITVALGAEREAAANQSQAMLQGVVGVGTSIRKALESRQRAQVALGSSDQLEPLPELEVLEPPVARGVAAPRVRGYDLMYQLRHNEHPFVLTGADKSLEVSQVPLTFRTASYDRAQASVAAGRLPATDEVRVEDFLAAQQYSLPTAPQSGVALHTAACPTPFSEPGRYLLQLSLQSGQPQVAKRPPTRLIAVVDTSSAMQAGSRDKLVVRALAKLSKQMLPSDRLTLVGYSDAPRVLFEDATRENVAALVASDGLEQTGGSADLLAAVQAAATAAAAVPSSDRRCVVLITSGGTLAGSRRETALEALAKLASSGTPWSVVELTQGSADAAWDELAQSARGTVRTAHSADHLFAACLAAIDNKSTQVAHGVSMRITFNPKTVASYRMLGHESTTLTGDAGDPLVVDLHADQVATCVYEVWLKPVDAGDLASVEVAWHHPTNGQPQRRVQAVHRSHFAPSFAQAPAWLQQGVVAARTAEFLRGSSHLPSSRRLSQLLELAGSVERSAAKTPEFRALVQLIEQAEKLR
jgi:hypothetical protein